MKKFIPIFIIGFLILSGISSYASNVYVNDNYEMIIITPTSFLNELAVLKEHKEQHTIPTKIVTIEEIYNSIFFLVQGRDEPEQIKYFIKDAIENWNTKYIMLVGGKENMPVRYSNIHPNSCIEYQYNFLFPEIFSINSDGFITDLYYADIYDENGSFCSWDSNNNDLFGEIGLDHAIDEVDLYPDVFVGRILCQTTEEVEIVVNKIIDYENNVFGEEWFNNLILCGGDTHPNTWEEILLSLVFKNITGMNYRLAWEGEYMCDEVAKCLDTFTAKKLYSSGFFKIRAKQLTIKNVNQAINDGAGFLLFSMHGSPTKIITYPPFNKKYTIQLPSPSGYSISNIEELNNYEKLPITVFGACSNGDFDTVSSPIAWEFVKYPKGGSIASFALTTEGNIYPTTMYTESLSGHTTMSIFEAYADGISTLGEIWGETIKRYLDDDIAWSVSEYLNSDGNSVVWLNFLALEEWILFGDPSLKIGGYY